MKCLVGNKGDNIYLCVLKEYRLGNPQYLISEKTLMPYGNSSETIFKSNFSFTVEIEIDTLDYEEVISKIPVELYL